MTDEDQPPPPDPAEQPLLADRALPEDEGAEADLLDQSRTVDEEPVVERSRPPADVNEADWLEQRIAEPIDDDLR